MVLNSVMVGFFGAVSKVLSVEALRSAIGDSVPASFKELNLKAFDQGYDFGLNKLTGETAPRQIEDVVTTLNG
jgi:2-oxoglutarate ferredoxin oxidoreductase subunit gamma